MQPADTFSCHPVTMEVQLICNSKPNSFDSSRDLFEVTVLSRTKLNTLRSISTHKEWYLRVVQSSVH
jgi:hypothetical protein